MSWEIFKAASGACADVNAWLELSNRVLGAIRARRMIDTRQQLPHDNTAAQHQIQEEMDRLETTLEQLPDDNTAAQHQIREETKLKQLWNDLWKLKTTMPMMIDLLDRVEWQSDNKAAADLLPYLKDAVYNAEDCLDEFDYYTLKVMSGQDHLHGDAFLEFFDKVKEIQCNLDHIHDQSKDLKLNEAPQKFNESIRPKTISFSDEPEIFGREKELKELVQKLGVQPHTRKRDRNASKMTELPVLPIVGLGGVGKTTMAQQICNDAKVKGHFDNIIWSCVSDEFDIKRLIIEILQHFGQQTSSDNLVVLMKDLARCVESKKFLLVLDDMWDDLLGDDGARWKIFCAPLREGLQGSTILVTTRSSKVANLVGTMKEHYELKGLQDDVFWDFFKLCAFGSNSSCNDRELLERIGKDILPKLKGSPLAAKTLGRLLKMDLSTAHWERILESELWQLEQKETDILPVLRLSYMYLPPHLKRCFSICALYPKDYIFEREFLVDIWIAQGYVVPKDASFHLDELVERSFFQKAGGTAHQSNKYVVHDLMHDMAQLVSKDECFIIRHASDLDRIPSNVRHLSIFTNGNVSCAELEIICNNKKLRSLVCNESFNRPNDFAHLIDCWFRKLLKIRVFSFKLSKVRELPESMGNTKHLRYLHLFGSSTFSTLPSSVRSLHHLTTVDARDCGFKTFPQGFSDVISLQKFQSRNFSYEKDHSDRLCLEWSTPVPSDQQTSDQQEQMEALPHWNIQELTIKYYKGESCPSWLRPNLLPRLRSLEFVGCPNIQSMLFFEPLCRDSQGSVSLPAQSHYRIEASSSSSVGAFSSLASLTVTSCDKLTSLPVDRLRGFSRLQELRIEYCPKLNIQRVMTLPSCLRKLHLDGCPSIESIKMGSSPALEQLYINDCPDLRSIGGSIALAQIGSVYINDCPGLTEVQQPFRKSRGHTEMSWEIFKAASGACADVNAWVELYNRVLGDNTDDNTAAQHQIKEEMDRLETTLEQLQDDNIAAQNQIREETKLKQLGNDLWKLKTTMPKMTDLLDRVEWQSHNKAAADLLPYMKDAVYNAEDFLDEFDYYALKVMSGQDHLHGDAFLEFFDKVKEIQCNLDHIHDQSKDLKLNEAPQKFNESIRPETSSFSDEPEIFGREKELKELVQKLGVQLHTRKRKYRNASKMTELPVLPIVGLGGVGKTTMAQQICNDAKVKGHFDSIIWSCISDEFDIKRLIIEILQHFGQQTSSDNLVVLMKDLARCVESKKFLLVLDDMWDDLLEDDGARWKRFCAPLREGLQGSTILVTTRSSKVANLVGTMEHYELKGLQDDVFWDFFKLCAFGSNSSCNDRELLERIGKDILPKLKGSPLAAKTLGRLLKMDLSTAHWERILESELWQLEQKETDIMPVLRLSYMYLPPHLKRCFSICALYPKDYIFEMESLVDIWIAQGYVEPKDAPFHFVELVERSFFQKAGRAAHQSNKYVVHDLMHDMAQLVSKDECFIIRHASDLDRIPSNVRHLSIFTNGNVSCAELEIICNNKKLRSLVCNESFNRPNDFAHLIDCWFRKLLKIRVFSFKLSKVRKLPESMGNTKHLRYLHLFGSSTFSTLPSSVRSLHHLTTVDARDCVFKRFPQGFSDVISLQKFQSRNFSYEKDHSDRLCLEWYTPAPSDQQTSDQQEQMEALPHWNIQELTIKFYEGESCPSWLRPNILPRLRRLEFLYFHNMQSISFFEPLCRDSQGSVSLPADSPYRIEASSSSSVGAFSSLADVTVDTCKRLLSLDEFLTPDYLPVIKHICVRSCSELTSLPIDRLRGFSRLQELSIEYCPKLNIQRVMTLPSCLKKLNLILCPSIESIEMGSSPALEKLLIRYCPDLRSIGGSIDLAQIGSVYINDCPGLTEVEQPFRSRGYTEMSWEIFKAASGACADVNAWLELSNRVLGAIRDRRIQDETKLEQLRNDLWKLKTTMPKMIDLLDRVEWQSHNKAAADLLPDMKDAVYNAEDLLDEFDYYALKVKAEEGARMSGQDHLHGDALLELFDKVKEIQGNLDHIRDQSKDLKLNEAPQKFNESIRPETSSFSDEPEIFGREKELKELVRKLGVQLHTRKRKYRNASKMTELPVTVLPIVGLGGVGKTTMAQQICNDAKVKGHFDNIIWSCVSDEFDIKRLMKEILQHFGQQTSSDNLNVLMKDLARCVESKKFLLVLDDMWDDLLEDDGARWKRFCAPLREGLQGSTILVTTRSSKVANLVGTMKPHYELKGLQDDVFWDFFKLCAFGSSSSCNDRELERIGKDILPKLKGSPLAAKTLGRLLKMDLSTAHWERILESELWQLEQKETDIMPVLRLSYMYLPPHLKRCFSICALYPKDYRFERDSLVVIWIAEGYVEPKDASFHFDELVERSFFQKAGRAAHWSDKYVVHDLMHDMAQLVSKDECFIIRHASDLDRIPSNVRHLSIFTNGNVSCAELEIICNNKKLRSLVCNESFNRPNDFAHLIDCWFRKLLKIRVFSFKLSKVRVLPESMGNTKHLRYLDLLGSSTFSTLPSSVRSLHHLKTVDARDCVFQRFPRGFSDVISLQKFQSRNFSYEKDHSDRLCLDWSTPKWIDQTINDQQEQMEALPHWNIQELTIKYYSGGSCPSWLRPNLLPRLRRLKIFNCDIIQSISFFEPLCRDSQGSVSLPADSPYRIEASSSSSSVGAFSSLADVTVTGCQGLLSLDEFLTPDYLPVIKHIRVTACDKLTSLPVDRLNGFSRLQELSIESCTALNTHRVMTLPSCLKKLKLSGCPSIESIKMGLSPALEHLYIDYCADVRSIGRSIALAQIGSVWIDGCPRLTEVEQPFRSRGYTDWNPDII